MATRYVWERYEIVGKLKETGYGKIHGHSWSSDRPTYAMKGKISKISASGIISVTNCSKLQNSTKTQLSKGTIVFGSDSTSNSQTVSPGYPKMLGFIAMCTCWVTATYSGEQARSLTFDSFEGWLTATKDYYEEAPGRSLGYISSTSNSAFPADGKDGSYWYVYKGAENINFVGYEGTVKDVKTVVCVNGVIKTRVKEYQGVNGVVKQS